MAEENDQNQELEDTDGEFDVIPSRRFLTRSRPLNVLIITAFCIAVFSLAGFIAYNYGVLDSYIKGQFISQMEEIGISFDADEFSLSITTLQLTIKNGKFKNISNGKDLFAVEQATLDLSIAKLFGWGSSRDIVLNKTKLENVEVWVKFDENGRSNFEGLKLVEDQAGASSNFKYDSGTFEIMSGTAHFGDISRKISGVAKDLTFNLRPEDALALEKRYLFEFTSKGSSFTWDERSVENISATIEGSADNKGANFTTFNIDTDIGHTYMSGTLTDWSAPRYNFKVESNVDLTRTADIISPGMVLTGNAIFNGNVEGTGENFKINGKATSDTLRVGDVYLKGSNLNGTIEGTNSDYKANGEAIAETLTFDDFRIDSLRAMGNVIGSGTDFRWLGELQAAAARSRSLTLGGLYLSDAFLEYKDSQLRAGSENGKAQKFAIGDVEFAELQARNLKFSNSGKNFEITSPNATTRSFKSPDFDVKNVRGRNVAVKRQNGETTVNIDGLNASEGTVRGNRANDLTADKLRFKDTDRSTTVTAENFKAKGLDLDVARVSGLETPLIELENTKGGLVVYSDKLRVASVDTDGATLGSMNIAGVRLTVKQGRVEVRSNDVAAGDIKVKPNSTFSEGGTLSSVTFARPVFLLEPSGRYRATADMSLGGGTLGSISLGNANASIDVNNERVSVEKIEAQLMNGRFDGEAVVALTSRQRSRVTGAFADLDIGSVLSIATARVVPLSGGTTGNIDMTFEKGLRRPSGELNASVRATAGSSDKGSIPVNGELDIAADNGSLDVRRANFRTEHTEFDAKGRAEFTFLDLFDQNEENSDLAVSIKSSDASEIDRLIRVTGLSPTVEEQLDSLVVTLAGRFDFSGKVTGDLSDPIVNGKASLDSISLRGRNLGSVTTDIFSDGTGTKLTNGRLADSAGGTALFEIGIPSGGINNTSIQATLNNIDAGNLLAALPVELPDRIRDVDGKATGEVAISGLPNAAIGSINLGVAKGVINGQSFDNLNVVADLNGTEIRLDQAEMNIGDGKLTANGTIDRESGIFNFKVTGDDIPAPLLLALAPQNDSIPPITGIVDFSGNIQSTSSDTSTYLVNIDLNAPNLLVGETSIGAISLTGKTVDRVLNVEMTAQLEGRPQVISATLDLGKENLPFKIETNFDQSPLSPFLAFVPQLKGMGITGRGTGRVEFGGDLMGLDADKKRVFTTSGLSGTAAFSELALQIQSTPLAAAEPIVVSFSPTEIKFERARFAGGGSNMTIAGTKALTDNGTNDLKITGRVNLNLLNLFTKDTFFTGFADTEIDLNGPNKTAEIIGNANFVNASVATFIGSDRFTLDRVKAKAIFTSNQVEIQEATGYLGGGRFRANGGGYLDGFAISSFRIALDGSNVTVPLPKDFLTTGDAQLEITGIRETIDNGREKKTGDLQLTLAGRVFARRAVYSKDIDLANIVGARRDAVLSGGGTSLNPPRFDLIIEGRDALVVKNNIADLTASVSLVLTGDANEPRISGRITANSGTILFRKDRYVVQRGVLEFPPDTAIDPIIELQAESEIAGYQVYISLSGPLKDTEQLAATVRSSPALPQADVVSLITTGSLTNTTGGIPTLAQTGINTAAEILTDSIINNPARRATDKLFGLNVFEIDPLISGQQANPGARLTVGRQINNNLRVTYATNLSQDQNQVLALEYRVSNRLSFVAQYEQRSLTNVTRDRDNFSFEVRFRKRF